MKMTSFMNKLLFNGVLAIVAFSIAFFFHNYATCKAAIPTADGRDECLKKAANAKDAALITAKNNKDAADINCNTTFDTNAKACATDSDTRNSKCQNVATAALAIIAFNYAYQSSLCAAATAIPPVGAACEAAASLAALTLTIAVTASLIACLLDARNERLGCEQKTRDTLQGCQAMATQNYNTAVKTANDLYDLAVAACPAAGGVVPIKYVQINN